MWRVRWQFTIVRQYVQRQKNHWAKKSSPVEARKICDAFMKKNAVANIFRNYTISIRGDTLTTLCKFYYFISFFLLIYAYFAMSPRRDWRVECFACRALVSLRTKEIVFMSKIFLIQFVLWVYSISIYIYIIIIILFLNIM